jgi:hypothetical protein
MEAQRSKAATEHSRRDAEDAENLAGGDGKNFRSLCALCVFAVKNFAEKAKSYGIVVQNCCRFP